MKDEHPEYLFHLMKITGISKEPVGPPKKTRFTHARRKKGSRNI